MRRKRGGSFPAAPQGENAQWLAAPDVLTVGMRPMWSRVPHRRIGGQAMCNLRVSRGGVNDAMPPMRHGLAGPVDCRRGEMHRLHIVEKELT